MVRTNPLTEVLSNMKLSFGASPGPVVRPTEVKNDFLLAYRGVGLGDDVAARLSVEEASGAVLGQNDAAGVSDTPSTRRFPPEPRPRRART